MSKVWRRVYQHLFLLAEFRGMNPITKLVALYTLIAQSNRIGLFVFSLARAAEDLVLEAAVVARAFAECRTAFRWQWEESTRLLYIPDWWESNPPDNPNNMLGNLKDLGGLPDSPLIADFIANTVHLTPAIAEAFRAATTKERQTNVAGTSDKHQPNVRGTEEGEGEGEEEGKEEGKGKKSEFQKRNSNAAHDLFANAFLSKFETPYPGKKGDFVQVASLLKTLKLSSDQIPPDWETAVRNYLASPNGKPSLADLATRYAVFRQGPLDRFGKPEEKPTGNGGKNARGDSFYQPTQ